ncbi:MAG: pantothenate kinase [Bacillus thermozeamaize]|jgi:type III pantothenate kinase|uniref:Type III pantothenate kinase n=1 Tax=Bacillus thermozeamaize TaxID=230954 RepID=A0A1Y3PD99_9BACI|nr:MAG: pantothenate kinase [Bacillus thermozeamaize]
MDLVIDVGNSNIVLGIYQDGQLLHAWRAATDRRKTEDEYGMLLKWYLQDVGLSLEQITGAIISSVVPPLVQPLARMCQKYLKLHPLIVGPGVRTGLNVKTENPREVGADRIVNAVAAIALYGPPLIIVDFGTATTFCAVNSQGEYLGGAIAPGIQISTEALYSHTAKLPRVEMVNPGRVIGKNTITSMQSGILYGFVGQVDGIVQRMKKEMEEMEAMHEMPGKQPSTRRITVVATGGLAEWVAGESETIDLVNPLLTLEGLYLILQRNRHHS